jgi:ABC-type Fe3+/spermidine/putrescine transport system ATPase subunit
MRVVEATRRGEVTVRDLTKSVALNGQRLNVLRDLQLDVKGGESLAIVGPSGCGKTTLLRILAGLEEPDEGGVLIDGAPVHGVGTERAIIFQEPRLLPWLTVLGVPVGREMAEGWQRAKETGSIIVIIATDAPLSDAILRQLAKRASLGIARSGTPGGNNSGDIFLAFSTANPGPMPQQNQPFLTRTEISSEVIDPIYLAAVEATEEAVINAMVAGVDVAAFKPKGLTVRALDTEKLAALFRDGSDRPDQS